MVHGFLEAVTADIFSPSLPILPHICLLLVTLSARFSQPQLDGKNLHCSSGLLVLHNLSCFLLQFIKAHCCHQHPSLTLRRQEEHHCSPKKNNIINCTQFSSSSFLLQVLPVLLGCKLLVISITFADFFSLWLFSFIQHSSSASNSPDVISSKRTNSP